MYNDSCNAECGLQLWNKVDTFLHACTHGISPVPKTVPIYIQPMHVSQKRVDIYKAPLAATFLDYLSPTGLRQGRTLKA